MKCILKSSIIILLLILSNQFIVKAQSKLNDELRIEFGTGYLNDINNNSINYEMDKLTYHLNLSWQINRHLFVGIDVGVLKLIEKHISYIDSNQKVHINEIFQSAIPINFTSKYLYNGFFIAFGVGVAPVFYELMSGENPVKFTENFVDVISKVGYEYRLSNSFLLSSNVFYMNILKLEQVKLGVQVNLIFSF